MPWRTIGVIAILLAFLRPLIEATLLSIGEWWFHVGYDSDPSRFSELIIQITTTGREQDRVNEIIAEIDSFELSMPYQVWVVNEPEMGDHYPAADRVATCPADFTARSQYKARAMEYSRRLRQKLRLNRSDIKLLFLDDDTSPTKAYVETAYAGLYDVCQGITAPRIQYGGPSLRHFLLSHMDDMRFLNCQTYCSFFQGLIRRPLHVHGEGLCVTGKAEEIVTWDYPVFASEDLVFGQNAADRGMRWGFFHEYIQLTSPWTWGAFLKQRRRWLWGNIHAITHREVLSLWPAALMTLKYGLGLVTFVVSLAGVVLILTKTLQLSGTLYVLFWTALAAWVGAFALSGWINSGKDKNQVARNLATYYLNRVWQSLAASLLSPLTATWTFIALTISLFKGNPRRFEVIAKTEEG